MRVTILEQLLENKEGCTLAESCPTRCDEPGVWLEHGCEYATLYASTVTLLPTHSAASNRVMSRNRRIGVGIIDYIGWVHQYGVSKVTKYLREGYKKIREVNRWCNGEAGVPEAIRVCTMKPGGTIPLVIGRRSGAGYSNFKYMIRRIRVQQYSPMYNKLAAAGIPHEPDLVSANTEVFEYPLGPRDGAKTAEEVTVWEQAMNLVLLQREWSDNAVSNTLHFKPKWILRRDISDPAEIKDYIELLETVNIRLIDGKYEDAHLRIIHGADGMKEYAFNPKHEENDIEPVLSAIAPLTKTVSMCPHTPKGVYKQMPEEGITEREYLERKKAISLIDWSSFRGNGIEVEVDKYCSGDKCEIK